MTVIQQNAFTGEFPRLLPHNLPPGAAQLTQDCDFTRGNLTGIKIREAVAGVYAPNAKSLFVYDSVTFSYYSWQRDVDAVRSPVTSDAYSRFYWCDGSNFWVSRGDIGGGGNEPSVNNRYKVGVPQPSAAMTVASGGNTFSVSGYSVSAINAFCERTDGTRLNVTPISYTTTTNSLTSFVASSNVSLSCPTGSSGSSGASSMVRLTEYSVAPVASGTAYSVSDLPLTTEIGYRKASDTGINTTALYIYLHNAPGGPVPASFRIIEGVYISSAGKYLYDLYHIGNNWYCTDQSATPPGGAASVVSSLPSSLAVEVVFTNSAGLTQKAILRRDSGKNTYPDAISSLGGSFNYASGVLKVSLQNKSDFVEARGYVYTYVNQYGEEGPPADPLVLDVAEGSTPSLRYTPMSSNLDYAPVSKIRVYRTATGTSNTDYLFVGEVVINSTNPVFSDTVATAALGESLQTRDYYPPDQNLRGLCALPNGILAAFKDNEVHFSESYLPYAWKTANIQTLQNRVVGICPFENGLYVTTTAHPVVITGVSPDTMTSQKIPAIQAGVSKGSICNAGPYVVYASHDGLVVLRGLDATLDLSFQFFTRDQWRGLYGNKLNQMRLNAHDGHLLMWLEDGSPGFLIRLDETNPSFTRTTDPVYCALVHPQSDALYVGAAGVVYVYKGGSTRLPFKWQSPDYVLNKPENLGCIQLVGSGNFQVTVFADGVNVYSTSVSVDLSGLTLLRLPSGFLARRWSFLVEGTADSYLYNAPVAGVPQELKNVG